tara:strand:+ start:15119 stop:15355 length:237 start_codon:yes stop_codon:yes gene_type:complete
MGTTKMMINVDFTDQEHRDVTEYLDVNITKTRVFIKRVLLALAESKIPVSEVINRLGVKDKASSEEMGQYDDELIIED